MAAAGLAALAWPVASCGASVCGDAVFSPAYFWMWNGKLDADALCAQLEDMRAHGLRNVCIHPFPKGFRDWFPTEMDPGYMTEGYLDVYAKVVRRAGELGMHAYLYDEGGWPSGGACGLVASSDSEGRFLNREAACAPGGAPVVRTRPYFRGMASYPSVLEQGTTQRFIELTHDVYASRLDGDLGKTVRIAFTDEPGVPRDSPGRSLAWTADFPEEFRRRKGYDIEPHISGLIADALQTNAALAQIRVDLMDVRADLFVERYFAPIRDWCRAHGMMSGGHLDNDDTPEFALRQNHGSLLRSLRAMDVPGIDVIWRQLFPADGGSPAKVNPFPRYASSAMHQNGGRFALSESFAIFGDSATPSQMKWIVDYQMVRGVNLFVLAYFAQSNSRHWMALFEPHAGPVTPYWDFEPHFFKYMERTSRFISQGRPGAETVVFFNTRAFWAGRDEAEEAAKAHYAVAGELDAMNCDYDFAEDRDLAGAEILPGGRLKIGAMEYRAVVLPSERWMLPEAKDKIAKFELAGGIVACGRDLAKVPRTLDVAGDGARAIRVMKRVDGARRIWFVVNEDMERRNVELTFPDGERIVRYDTERDAYEAVSTDGKVRRTFDGGESAIYVTGDCVAAAPVSSHSVVRTIDSGWTLRALVSHEAGAKDFEIKARSGEARPVALGDWRGVLGGTFSGRALYRAEFDSGTEGDAFLDLGEVKWCASARLNGEDLGARFFGPFRWPVKVKKGRNVLEVTVANLLANQVGDDAIRDRILRDWQPNGKYDKFLRPFDRQNHESGLFGPVMIFSRADSHPRMITHSPVDREFLKGLIRIPSVSEDVAEVNRAADFTRRYAESRGLFCHVETNASGRCMVWVANVEGKSPDVLLSAHMDVVPAQSPEQFVPKESDGRIYGRGASDCKEHVALSLCLIERLAGRVSVGAIFGTDEEIGGLTTAEMMKCGYGAKRLVIVLDSEQFAITTRQKGLARYVVEKVVPPSHAGMAKGAPPNAVQDLVRRYEEIALEMPGYEDGSWRDVIMLERVSGTRERAEIEINVRCARHGGFDAIENLLRNKFKCEPRCIRKGEAVLLDETQPYLVDFRERMRRKWPDRKIDFYHMNSSTDARHLQYLNLPMLILGVDARGAHTAAEYVEVASLDEYADLIEGYLAEMVNAIH